MPLMKQTCRNVLSRIASYMEILLAVFILMGIALSIAGLWQDVTKIFVAIVNGDSISNAYSTFFAFALEIVIAVEFLKMLVRHTPESVVEVLLFVIARKITVSAGANAGDIFVEVLAIAILFLVKYFLIEQKSFSFGKQGDKPLRPRESPAPEEEAPRS